jgi:hypothetical protein
LRSQLTISQALNTQQGLLLLCEKQPPPYRALTLADLHPSRNPFSALLENHKNESVNSESAATSSICSKDSMMPPLCGSSELVVALANASVQINTNVVDSFLMRREATSVNTHRNPLSSLHNRLRDDLRMLTEKDPLTATETCFYHVGRILSEIPGVPAIWLRFHYLTLAAVAG